jgi:cytochrome P450
VTISPGDVRAILGFDPFAPEFHADPYAQYRSLREGGALQRSPGGLWLSLSFAMCTRILRDPRFGHGGGLDAPLPGTSPRLSRPVRSFLILDPPEHTRLRRLVSRAFTARLVERLRPRVEALVDDLLARMNGEVDLVAALAHPLPVIVISEMLDVPEPDRERFIAWSDALARGLDPDFLVPAEDLDRRDQARAEFAAYLSQLAARRRADPGEDLLSGLVSLEGLSEDDLVATCILVLVAGHETTVNLIANGALALLRDPDRLADFRANPDRTAAFVEELLRYDPPVQFSARVALEDVEIGGQRIRRGEVILLLLGAAHRDPEEYADPDRLDLTRWTSDAAPRHLAFGQGIHFCLGAPLARIEGQLALARLFQREVALLPGALEYRDNLVLRGLKSLPVRVT